MVSLFFNQDIAKRKVLIIFIIFVITISFFLSVLYITHEYEHYCEEEHCSICIVIQQCENTVKQMGFRLKNLSSIYLILFFVSIKLYEYSINISADSLVSKKIRLNN